MESKMCPELCGWAPSNFGLCRVVRKAELGPTRKREHNFEYFKKKCHPKGHAAQARAL